MLLTTIQNWFHTNLAFSMDDVMRWIIYNPKEPLLFNTVFFLELFILFYSVYICTRKTFNLRLVYVILFSLFFYYKSSGVYFLLLLLSSLVDYLLSGVLYKEQRSGYKKLYLWISIIINLGLLGYFKYTNFLVTNYNELFGGNLELHKILLPVGISFYTFQSISYIIEIYRKEIKPTNNYIEYLFFISFFPQLVAGPIVRAKDFLPQIYTKLKLTREDVNTALFLIIGGLIKKIFISDYISINFVDRVFDTPNNYTSFENIMAVYGYAIQIYCDFSGYSDMAIGIALLLGFKLPINFRTPYKSASIMEFWRRWHISLSRWLRDFLYISVGGNRKETFAGFLFSTLFFSGLIIWGIAYSPTSSISFFLSLAVTLVFILTFILSREKNKTMFTNVNLMTTMLLGGLWHGASLRFIIWGALHGLALAVHRIFVEFFPSKKENENKIGSRIWTVLSVLFTFHFVAFCWLFFRAKDFPTVLQLLMNIGKLEFNLEQWKIIIIGYKNVFLVMVIGYMWHFLPENVVAIMRSIFDKTPIVVKAIIMALTYWVVYATATSGSQPFIYFQF